MEEQPTNNVVQNQEINNQEPTNQKPKSNKLPIIIAVIFSVALLIVTTILILTFSAKTSTPKNPDQPVANIKEVKSYVILDDFDYDRDLVDFVDTKNVIASYSELQNFYSDIENYYLGSIDPDIYYNEPTDCAGGPEGTDCESYIETQVPIETPIKKIDELNEEFFDEHDLIITSYINMACGGGFNRIRNVSKDNGIVTIEIGYDSSCGPCAPEIFVILVEAEKDFATESDIFKTKKVVENNSDCDSNMAYKPIIYLYPEEETVISVKLGKPELLTTTYPKYNEETGWQVVAKPDGTLISGSREYYGLYWEGKNKAEQKDEGFIVAGEDTVKFLEEKLEVLGLDEREANEFIIYWLPKMEGNSFNYIRFATSAEIEEGMPLEVSPKPNTTIRILMEYKPLNQKIEIKEQKLEKVERKGYTVVEWGGTEIK